MFTAIHHVHCTQSQSGNAFFNIVNVNNKKI